MNKYNSFDVANIKIFFYSAMFFTKKNRLSRRFSISFIRFLFFVFLVAVHPAVYEGEDDIGE
jgi:hypothetical protein